MQSIRLEFTAAAGKTRYAGIGFTWIMIWAIAILNDSDRREKERRRKGEPAKPQARPRPPADPRM